ncbi:hypothetical protein DSCO28_14980 [Desulfosarcina ovata subsp. sediminis]|uniref:Uncharacterized protein n=2 Tax=Desulfosarcina ovata TaxID=83564 RepID=A0A5K7ZFS6_9BACT|nr:hypothetical protein DSCO28_14980 [Desulfosarcina ovata subsp. sediminis]
MCKETKPLQLWSSNRNKALDRQEALDFLASLGIENEKIYLIDLVPLIEMIWADGKIQPGELVILKCWLHKHVEHINHIAGYKIIRLSDAMQFAQRFLTCQPKPGLLKKIRHCIGPVRMHTPGRVYDRKLLKNILFACLDIASSSVREYPYKISGRFSQSEKNLFLDILATFREYATDTDLFNEISDRMDT